MLRLCFFNCTECCKNLHLKTGQYSNHDKITSIYYIKSEIFHVVRKLNNNKHTYMLLIVYLGE